MVSLHKRERSDLYDPNTIPRTAEEKAYLSKFDQEFVKIHNAQALEDDLLDPLQIAAQEDLDEEIERSKWVPETDEQFEKLKERGAKLSEGALTVGTLRSYRK